MQSHYEEFMKIINNNIDNEKKFAEFYKSIKNGKKKFKFINFKQEKPKNEMKRRSPRLREKEKQLKHLHLIK